MAKKNNLRRPTQDSCWKCFGLKLILMLPFSGFKKLDLKILINLFILQLKNLIVNLIRVHK